MRSSLVAGGVIILLLGNFLLWLGAGLYVKFSSFPGFYGLAIWEAPAVLFFGGVTGLLGLALIYGGFMGRKRRVASSSHSIAGGGIFGPGDAYFVRGGFIAGGLVLLLSGSLVLWFCFSLFNPFVGAFYVSGIGIAILIMIFFASVTGLVGLVFLYRGVRSEGRGPY